MTCLGLAAAFADLLLDFLGDEIDRRVEVSFAILGKKIRTAHAQSDGAGERPFRNAIVVVFEGDACVNGSLVEVIQLFNLGDDVVLDGLGQCYAVRNENQFHTVPMMRPGIGKIQ